MQGSAAISKAAGNNVFEFRLCGLRGAGTKVPNLFCTKSYAYIDCLGFLYKRSVLIYPSIRLQRISEYLQKHPSLLSEARRQDLYLLDKHNRSVVRHLPSDIIVNHSKQNDSAEDNGRPVELKRQRGGVNRPEGPELHQPSTSYAESGTH